MPWPKAIWGWFRTEENIKFVDTVLKGESKFIFRFENERLNTREFRRKLEKAKNHLEMINVIRPFFSTKEFYVVLGKCEKLLGKSNKIAQMFLDKAKQFQNDTKLALRAHNLALSFAESSRVLGEVYRARSALLFFLGDFSGCTLDIELGRSLGCPVFQIQELRNRLFQCQLHTKSINNVNPTVVANREYCKNVLFCLEGKENELLMGASNLIEIRKDENNKRGLFATGSVPLGTPLIVENAFVSILTDGLNWDMTHCWKCSKSTDRSVACPTCVFATYCSEECRLSDLSQGHLYECSCLPYFHGANLPNNTFLGFKAVCKAGPAELHKIYSASEIYGDFRQSGGFDPVTRKYDGNSYLTVLNLIAHVENNEEVAQQIFQALCFIEVLSSRTNFFDQIQDEKNMDEFKNFVASIAFYHAKSAPFNCMAFTDMKNQELTYADNNICELSFSQVGLYGLISLMNHSCDPTVGRANLIGGRVVIMAMKDLKEGDELLMSYGYEFASIDSLIRQEILWHSYHFMCDCLACKNNWPVFDDLGKLEIRLKCPDCTQQFTYKEFKKCTLDTKGPFQGTCRNCKKVFDLEVLYDAIKNYPSLRKETKKCLREHRPADLVPIVVKYCQFYQARVCPPSLPLTQAHRILKRAYFDITHMED